MDAQDLSTNLKLARLKELTRELKESRTPEETVQALQRGLTEPGRFIASVLLSTRGLPPRHYRVLRADVSDDPKKEVLHLRTEPGPERSVGLLAEIVTRPDPQLIQRVDWSSDPLFREILDGYVSVLALPVAGDHMPMNWLILLKKAPEPFTILDLEHAVERTTLVSSLLENQILAGELAGEPAD